jgi:parvulin-like peptidyl-prolyl isomerase
MAKKATTKKQSSRTKSVKTAPVTHKEEMHTETPTQPEMKTSNSRFRNWLIPALIVIFALGYMLKSYLVAATVNGQPITRLAVISELEKQGGKKVLDAIVTKTLIDQEAKKKGIKISQKEIDEEISKIEKNISAQGMSLDDALKSQGMTRDTLKEEIELQLTLEKLVGNAQKPTDKEVEDYRAMQLEQAEGDETQVMPREQVEAMLTQQKQQENLQTFVENLRKQAKVNYFVQY